MEDTLELTKDQSAHIARLQAKVDLMEHGVIHAATPLLTELADAAVRDGLTVERFRAAVENFNALLESLGDEQRDLDSTFDYYVKKNSEAGGTANA